MNPNAEELAEALRDYRHERRIRKRIRERQSKPPPMDEITRDTLIAEVTGKEPPPMIIPVLKKRRQG